MPDSIFRCAQCGVIVSRALSHQDNIMKLLKWGRQGHNSPSLVPSGLYTTAASVLDAGLMWEEFCPRDEIIFNRQDLITHPTMINERDSGCCGYVGWDGYNVFCVNGHGFATEFSDCWGTHYVHTTRELLQQEPASD